MVRTRRSLVPILLVFLLVVTALPALAGSVATDINPNVSNNADADASTGGRVNGLAVAPGGGNSTVYAASEYGGLFKSTNSGASWARLNRHLPTRTWDVLVEPSNASTVYATSWYDGRINSISGIQVSTDGGTNWTHPATATPTTGTCNNAMNRPFGYRMAAGLANGQVYAGTHCGLARSNDFGATWTFLDPEGATNTAADTVWDVIVQPGGPTGQGIIDVCGQKRHWRSTNGGATWTGGSAQLPAGRCSIAVSPDESYVLFVYASDNSVYESDDGGANWTNLGTPEPRRQGRVPFVVTNQRSDAGANDVFDLWASDVGLFSASCTTPATPAAGGTPRCPAAYAAIPNPYPGPPAGWVGSLTRSNGAHDDAGDLIMVPGGAADACPLYYSSDGGFHVNTNLAGGCQNPSWNRSNVGLHALWLFTMDGSDVAGTTNEDLYFGTQDNGIFGATDAGSATPTWNNATCCDGFVTVAQPGRVVYVTCCQIGPGGAFIATITRAAAGATGGATVSPNPPGTIPLFNFTPIIDDYGDKQFVMATSGAAGGVFITNDITLGAVTWTELGGAGASPANTIAVWAAVTGGNPTFYTLTTGGQIWQYVGTSGGTWARVDNNGLAPGGASVFNVDEGNPNRLALATPAGNIFFSTDGGTTWNPDAELDTLMTGNGFFRNRTPTLLAFDSANSNLIVAGGADSGVFLSTDGGANWGTITDPINSGASGIVHLPEPYHAYFDHEPAGTTQMYIGTRGRGIWRFDIAVPTADAGGPYNGIEGTDVALTGAGSSDPNGQPLSYAWDLDNDGAYDDSTSPTPDFTMVGQDGVYTIGLKVTAGGVVDTDTTTVTIANVLPTVSVATNGPKPENQQVTASGVVSDPGWLDPLTATIDWGDGTAIVAVSGTLENVRPDATLTYSATHTYGDNGTFTVTVCGSDDDTTVCNDVDVTITNVDPTADIDETGTILVNGVPTFIAHAGDPVDFAARSVDPGSDDLTFEWDWDDGAPAPDVTNVYLVNPPFVDPLPSPSIQPRDVTDLLTHIFGDACLYEIEVRVTDDDAGSAVDGANVIILGNATQVRSAGYWQHQYKGNGQIQFTTDELNCYLDIASYMSTVFNETTDASTIDKAFDVIKVNMTSAATELLDRQLLAAWLNFANGTVGYFELIDTNYDGIADTPFNVVMATAEAVRNNPAATRSQLLAQKDRLESFNR